MADRLPIYDIERDLVARLKADRRLILSAPTGSGKSTQVPQMLLKHGLLGDGQVVILQPRRLAARLLAARVARELNVGLGREVGYQVRFENVTSGATRIKFETEGILLRQLIQDPGLRGVQAVLFDEFHERHLYGDITLARVLDIQETRRPDLLVAVMSATLDSELLGNYLNGAGRVGGWSAAAVRGQPPLAVLRPCFGRPGVSGRNGIFAAPFWIQSAAGLGSCRRSLREPCPVRRTGRRAGVHAGRI